MDLLPRDEKFFDLLVEQAKIVLDASNALAAAAGNGAGDTARKVRDLERKGDQAFRQIKLRLHKTFITPLDPEDIHQLASLVDEILDHLEGVAYRIEAYGLDGSGGRTKEIAGMVHGCVQATVEAIEALRDEGLKKPEEFTARCDEINKRELETEVRVRETVRDLFASERDPIALVKQKEVYDLLESTADCCENVADVLESIAVKNS